MMHYRFFLACSALLLVACSPGTVPTNPDVSQQISVATTFYPLAFLAHEIGGDLVSVLQVTPAGVEPHDFEPSPQQLANVQDADIFLMNGVVDGWADAIINELKQNGVVTLKMTELVSPTIGSTVDEQNFSHIWLNPVLMKRETEFIRDAFLNADPLHADDYRKNADALIAKFSTLDAEYRGGLASCEQMTIVTSHNAFRSLANEYGFETLAIAGISPEEEPSPKRIAELADLAKREKIRYIFFETLASPKLAETVAHEIGAQALVLNPIEGLTAEEEAAGKDYISLMRDNLQNLQIAMQCQ